MRTTLRALGCVAVLLLVAATPAPALAHDPSLWGGLYRARDDGAVWLPAHGGRFITATLGLAVSPTDSDHLLMATDSGLLRSRNGGLDWEVEAPEVLRGAVFAAAFDRDGSRVMAATASSLYVAADDGAGWRAVAAPAGSAPARALVVGVSAGRVYLAGWQGLARSEDWGATWAMIADGLPSSAVTALAVAGPEGGEAVWVVASGQVWASPDGGRSWRERGNGLPGGAVQVVAAGRAADEPLWAAGADRLFRSDDRGAAWRPIGGPLPDSGTSVRGIASSADGRILVLATDRGLLRSADSGATWDLLVENLPVHLESRPLVRDPHRAGSLYAGYSIVPYDELWRSAAEGRSALARLDPLNLAGAAAFLALLGLGSAAALRRLARYYGAPAAAVEGDRLALGRVRR